MTDSTKQKFLVVLHACGTQSLTAETNYKSEKKELNKIFGRNTY